MKSGEIRAEQYSEEGLGEFIMAAGKELKRISKDGAMGENYLVICALALELLDQVFQEEYGFPIEIKTIAEKMDVHVFYRPLNSEEPNGRIHKMVGKLVKKWSVVTGNYISGIMIDEESDRETQRYGLAHELAHYLMRMEEKQIDSEYHTMPMLFMDMEEMVADIFAIFLLIPIPRFLKEFLWYIGEDNVPVQTSDWLEYLGRVTEVPYEEVAIGYQNIRYVCGLLYEIKHEKRKQPEIEDEQVKKIVDRQIHKIIECLEEEGIEAKLFC